MGEMMCERGIWVIRVGLPGLVSSTHTQAPQSPFVSMQVRHVCYE